MNNDGNGIVKLMVTFMVVISIIVTVVLAAEVLFQKKEPIDNFDGEVIYYADISNLKVETT